MDNNAYTTVADGQSRTEQDTRTSHQKQLHLFPAAQHIQFMVPKIFGSITKGEILQLARNFLKTFIRDADKGQISHYSFIDERRDSIRRQLGHWVGYFEVPTNQKQTAIHLEVLCGHDHTFGN